MVLDASVLWSSGPAQMAQQMARQASGFAHEVRPDRLERDERLDESPEERSARVRRLAEQVRSGSYAVHSHRLATALLEWDPRRGGPKQSAEVADRRRSYMRDYMRRRRAQSAQPATAGESVLESSVAAQADAATRNAPRLWASTNSA